MHEHDPSMQRLTQNCELRMGTALHTYRCCLGYLEYVVSRKHMSEKFLLRNSLMNVLILKSVLSFYEKNKNRFILHGHAMLIRDGRRVGCVLLALNSILKKKSL